MNYKLAKQLKDAGFPNIGRNPVVTIDEIEGNIYYPTLSELIEACGDNFSHLYKLAKGWVAIGTTKNDLLDALGKTPKVAVAKLWLKLMKGKK